LDKYFALWRCRALFHVYFAVEANEERRYVTFDKESKKILYLHGKKLYNYSYPKAPFPPASFFNQYTIDEEAYREKKAEAFKHRTVSNMAKRWLDHRNILIRTLVRKYEYNYQLINDIFKKNNLQSMSERAYKYVLEDQNEINEDENHEIT